MATVRGVRAGRAFVELFADDSRLVRGLKHASVKLKAWGQSITAMGKYMFGVSAAMGSVLAGATKHFASAGDELQKMSLRTGISVESLSQLSFAAEQSGTNLVSLESGVRHMQRAITEAIGGSKSAAEALDNLGLSAETLAHLSPEQQFKRIADGIASIYDPTLQAAASMEIFGRSGTQLLPLLQQGASGIEALQSIAASRGFTISTEEAQAAAAFTDTMHELWLAVKSVARVIGSELALYLTDLAKRITPAVVQMGQWIKENKSIVIQIAKLIAIIVATGGAFMLLGPAISGLGAILGIFATILTSVAATLSIVITALWGMLSPIRLLIVAAAYFGGSLSIMAGNAQQALLWLGNQFTELKNTAISAWEGISDALAAGDIGLAARIVWLTLKMEWQKGIAWLSDKWEAFRGFFVSLAGKLSYDAARFMVAPWQWVKKAWVEFVSFLSEAWLVFTNTVADTWGGVVNWVKKQAIAIAGLFDESIDVEAEQRRLDEERAREKQMRQQAMLEEFQRIDAERQAKLNAINDELSAEQKAQLAALDAAEREEEERRRKAREADMKAAEEAIAKATKEWQDALAEARRKREEAAKSIPGQPKGAAPPWPDLDFERRAEKSASIMGTFNPMAIAQLAAGGPAERTARATEETARNTGKIIEKMEHGGARFTP